MAEQVTAIDRRQYPRAGVMKQLADITYAVLRRHQIGEDKTEPINSSAP
jgi:hypothetical protein